MSVFPARAASRGELAELGVAAFAHESLLMKSNEIERPLGADTNSLQRRPHLELVFGSVPFAAGNGGSIAAARWTARAAAAIVDR